MEVNISPMALIFIAIEAGIITALLAAILNELKKLNNPQQKSK